MHCQAIENINGNYTKEGKQFYLEPFDDVFDPREINQWASVNGYLLISEINKYNYMGLNNAKKHHSKQLASQRWHYFKEGIRLKDAGLNKGTPVQKDLLITLNDTTINYSFIW